MRQRQGTDARRERPTSWHLCLQMRKEHVDMRHIRIRMLVTLGVALGGMLALAGWPGMSVVLGASPAVTSTYYSDVQPVQNPVGEGCLPWSLVYPPNPR